MDRSLEIPGLNLEDISSGDNDSSLTETMALTKEEENTSMKLNAVDDDNNYKDRIRRHTEREKEIERECILDHYQNNHGRNDMESVNELIENLKNLTLFNKRIHDEESTGPSNSSTSLDDDDNNKFQKSNPIPESRFERHRTDEAENYQLNSTVSEASR